MVKETETAETIVFFVTFSSFVVFQLWEPRPPSPPGYTYDPECQLVRSLSPFCWFCSVFAFGIFVIVSRVMANRRVGHGSVKLVSFSMHERVNG